MPSVNLIKLFKIDKVSKIFCFFLSEEKTRKTQPHFASRQNLFFQILPPEIFFVPSAQKTADFCPCNLFLAPSTKISEPPTPG